MAVDLQKEILEALEKEAPKHDMDIVDVEVVGSAKSPIVRVRIDHADETLPSISLDEVAREQGWISDLLDTLDPIASSYVLEVSSPGMARPLRRLHDFQRFAGKDVSIKLKSGEGPRRLEGKLEGITGTGQVVVVVEGQQQHIDFDTIKSAKIKPDYTF